MRALQGQAEKMGATVPISYGHVTAISLADNNTGSFPEYEYVAPETLVDFAKEYVPHGNIGEHSYRLSDDYKQKHATIPWSKISRVGMIDSLFNCQYWSFIDTFMMHLFFIIVCVNKKQTT